ncbi:MAG: GNAT family N-acetyltransferase, partial [Eubacteriales bacterium]|nr:GNAT family N-acetyltransferase [Eubacteriales bacterium]
GWSRDLVSAFGSYEAFSAHGIGCAVLFGDTVVSGASSYSYYSGGIEIEIDTRADFRRRGLALACGARLILECLDRGLYPSWDAQNLGSLSLAKKLGYEFSHEYPAYEIFDY